jgi:hypothetical protein
MMLAFDTPIARVPSNLNLLRRSTDREIAFNGLVLSLCQQDSAVSDSEKWVDTLLEQWGDDENALLKFLGCSVTQLVNQPHADSFFLRFWDGVNEKNVHVRQRALRVMMDLLSRRVTCLKERIVWEQLSLPVGLHAVISAENR